MKKIILSAALVALGSPAIADHLGPSGFGSGGGMSVFTPDTLDAGHWSAGFRVTYTRPEQRSNAELEALAPQHIHAHNTDYNLNAALSAAYGITHHLTVSAELPYIRRDDLREGTHEHVRDVASNGVDHLGSVAGIGDMSILAKYRLGEGGTTGFAVIGGIKIPTGSTHKQSPDGDRLETEHQPGTGSWDPIVGATGSTKIGALQLTASAIYQFSTEGAQHTRLGDRLQAGAALSHRFGPALTEYRDSHNHHHGDELDAHHERAEPTWDVFVEVASEWEGRQSVENELEEASGGKWVYVAPGVRFNAAAGWSAGAAIALPIWQHIRASHPNNRYRLMLSLGRAF